MSLERSIKEPHSYIIRQNERMYEHRDSQATAMSVDWSGQYVLLAGRRHLALQKLEKDEDPLLRKYDRYSKHDVSAAEWAICQYSQEYCAIATSQLIEVVTWSSSDPTLIHSLRAHTRMVTDIDWHSKEPHLLASCSIDTFTHLWDLRDPRKPTLSLSAVCMSGATQVGFNRVSGNLLGTAHDGDLRIWDIRKGSCPIQYITAHLSRVHGINWSHKEETCLTTASQDGTVKYFDVNNSKRAEKIITTTSPVWRARFTPIGNGLVTVVVPHLGRGDNSLMLWSNNKQSAPVCSFVGHTDVILDFAWRPNRQSTSNEMELITWSRDQTLRLWRIDDALMQHCEEEEGQSVQSENDWNGKSSSCSLQHEFSLLNRNIPHMQIEAMDSAKRYAIFKIVVSKYVIILQVNFPEDYPKPNVYPEFDFLEGTQIDDDHIALTITKVLKTTALQRVKRGRSCLEQCIRNLVTALKKCVGNSNDKSSSALLLQSPRLEGALSGTLHDACVPYPRTSGVCFNNAGLLVHFSQNFLKKRISLRQHQQTGTPRALSAISGGFLGNVMGTQPVLYAHRDSTSSSFYDRISIGRASASSKNRRIQPSTLNIIVNIYDFQRILNLSKDFAREFILQKFDLIDTCRHNRKIFEEQGRLDLYIWNLAELIASSNQPFESVWEMNFYKDPFKKIILEALIFHYAKNGDVQTAAILCCLFQNFFNHKDVKTIQKSPNESPYHTILPMDSANQYLALQIKQFRCNSRSNSLDFSDLKSFNFSDSSTMSSPVSLYSGSSNSLINKSKLLFFDSLKKLYAELLFAWGFYIEKTSILKHLSLPQDQPQKCVEFVIECSTCNRVNRTTSCMYCRKIVLYCTLCRLPVKGSASACLLCGHGGHTNHMDTWFQNNSVCASGCGCSCIIQTSTLLQRIV